MAGVHNRISAILECNTLPEIKYVWREREMKGNGVGTRFLIVLFIIGVVLTYIGAMDLIRGSKTPVDFDSLKASDVKKGIIVEGNLYANLGAFMESYTTRNGVKTGSSNYTYLIPIGSEEYMGLYSGNSSMQEELDAQTDATFNYLTGITSTEPVSVHFKGRVIGMDSKEKGYMHDYMIDMGFTESEITDYTINYYIKCENYDGGLIEMGIGIVCLLIGAAIILVPMLSARKAQDTAYSNSAFGDLSSDAGDTSQTSDIFNMDNSESHMDISGLGAGLADEYKQE